MSGFGPRASTTCLPSRARTSRSSPAARSCSRISIGALACVGRAARALARSAATCWRSAGSLQSCERGSRARSPRWPGSPRGRGTAGTSCCSARRFCSRGTRTRSSMPGFQLSFAAVAAIFVVVPRLERTLAGYPVPRSLGEVVAVSAACGVATAPILLTQFGTVPLYSIPANALAFPVVAPLLGIALVTALVAPAVPPLAVALAWLNGWLAAYLAGCARLVGGLPHAAVSARTAIALGRRWWSGSSWLVSRLRPPRAPRAAAVILLAALVAGGWRLRSAPPPLPAAGGTSHHVPRRRPGRRRRSCRFRVGPCSWTKGPPEADVAGQLRRLGVKDLSLVVLTHPQRDHIGGAAKVLERLRVGARARSGDSEQEPRGASGARGCPSAPRADRRRPGRAGLSHRPAAPADPVAGRDRERPATIRTTTRSSSWRRTGRSTL